MEFVSCALCGADHYRILAREALYGVSCTTVICRRCGLVYVNPRMDASERQGFYISGYREREFGQGQPTADFLHKAEREATARLEWCGCHLMQVATPQYLWATPAYG